MKAIIIFIITWNSTQENSIGLKWNINLCTKRQYFYACIFFDTQLEFPMACKDRRKNERALAAAAAQKLP